MSDKKNSCKIVMLGESGVGKTCIINRYINDSFDEYCGAIHHSGFAFKKEIKIPEKGITLELELWDTPGNERSRSFANIFCNLADIFLLVYSVTDWNSFKELKNFWYPLAKQYETKNLIIGIAGNKCDLYKEEEVSEEEGRAFAKEINAVFQSTSPAEYTGIEELFEKLIDKHIEIAVNSDETQKSECRNSFRLSKENMKKKNIC